MDWLRPSRNRISPHFAYGAAALLACTLATPASALIVPRPAAALIENCATQMPGGNDGFFELGGVPSRLEAMRARQAGAVPTVETGLSGLIAVTPSRATPDNGFALASTCTVPAISAPQLPEAAMTATAIATPAVKADMTGAGLGGIQIAAAGAIPPALLPDAPSSNATSPPFEPTPLDLTKPDIFGSVALAVSRTPLDSKWQRAAGGALSPRGRLWRGLIGDARKLDTDARIDLVNQWVNRRVRFADDSARFAVGDRWASAAETLRAGIGDCEDYAIAKMKLLEAAGVNRDDMFLVIAKDLVRRADHALLVVRNGTRLVVLDNVTDRIVDAAPAQDYRPVMSYSAGKAWIHGYESEAAPSVHVPIERAPIERMAVRVAILGD